jgi:hypothetical protein
VLVNDFEGSVLQRICILCALKPLNVKFPKWLTHIYCIFERFKKGHQTRNGETTRPDSRKAQHDLLLSSKDKWGKDMTTLPVVSSGLQQHVHAMIDTELSSVTLGHFCQISVRSNACINPVSLLVAVFNCLVQDSFSLRHNKWSSMCDKNHSFLLSQVQSIH